MSTIIQSLKRSIRRGLAGLSFAMGISGVAHAGVPVIDGGHIGAQVAEFAQQATRYAEEMKKWQEQLQNWQTSFQNWQKTFTQSQFGSLQSLISGVSIKPDDKGTNSEAMKEFIAEYNKNSRCNKMGKEMGIAYKTCWSRHNLEVKKMQDLASLTDYNEKMDKEIKTALDKAESIDGNNEAQKKSAALAAVQALQNKVRDKNTEFVNTAKNIDYQIEAYKAQQAAIAQNALSGKTGGVVGGAISAGLVKGAFSMIKRKGPCPAGSYMTYSGTCS